MYNIKWLYFLIRKCFDYSYINFIRNFIYINNWYVFFMYNSSESTTRQAKDTKIKILVL